jgi:glycosyltransferase involved in cell wall biosynthesis/molybdenum cofactor biosynthesis enzyme MoaA
MLVGFEDLDFSLRAFRSGYKVGSSGTFALVHDHARTDSDKDYERIRFSRSKLREAALYLEGKTGYRLWGDEVENWLRDNEAKHGHASAATESTGPIALAHRVADKPVIALITDTDDWAFSRIARQLERHLSHKYEFLILAVETLNEVPRAAWLRAGGKDTYIGGVEALGMALTSTAKADITHVFWREYLSAIATPLLEQYARTCGLTYSEFERRFIKNRILSTAVYDHLFLEEAQIAERAKIFNLVSGYYVASQRLEKIYRDIGGYPPPAAVLPDGVDLDALKPENLERLRSIHGRNLVLGWVGNSKWASSIGDPKGLHSLLIPAVNALQQEGCRVVLKVVDRQTGHVPHEKMAGFYAEIDVYVCMSQIEGTPNPVLEAMACGVPVISTDVGIVPEVFGDLQREFILPERTIDALKVVVRKLLDAPDLLSDLSQENLKQIQAWSWPNQVKRFEAYFDSLLERRRVARGENRTKICMLPFTTPSMETTGDIRLCSASSIFDYREETNMGNCRTDGLDAVWTGEKYRRLRQSLFFGGDKLTPYCDRCEYRFDGPAWFMRLHLALHAYHNGVQDPEIISLIETYRPRADEYRALAPSFGIGAYPLPPPANVDPAGHVLKHMPGALVTGERLPIYLDLNTLNRCNVSCTMCPPAIRYDDLKEPKSPLYRLTMGEYKAITAGLRIASAHFVGAYAEPLMNKEIVDLVRHAHAEGAFTAITTNATLLNERMSVALVDAGLSMLSISLHGATKEIAEKVMRKSDFGRVISNIRKLQEIKRARGTSSPEIYFNYVAQCVNIDDFPAFIDLAGDLNVKFVNLIHLIDGDEAVDESQNPALYPDNLVRVVQAARRRAEQRQVILNVSPAYATLVEQREREIATHT